MQIRLFLSDPGSLKKDAQLKDLSTLKQQKNIAFVLVNNEADFFKILDVAWKPMSKEMAQVFKQYFVVDQEYIIQCINFFNFYEHEIVKTTIKMVIMNNIVVIYNKHDNQHIKYIFDKIFKENHNAQQSTSLFYCTFLHKILESYISLLDTWVDDIANAEILILEQKSQDMSTQLANIRKRVVYLRAAMQDLIDQLEELATSENALFAATTKNFEKTLKKAYSVEQALEKLNSMIINVYNLYLAHLSTRQNEISKMLTIIATIFMPVTFITGFFGMNFHMPFLENEYAYILCAGSMFIITLVAIAYFKKRNWI